MKKRNKKYSPKKIGQQYASKAYQLHTLEMTFTIDEVNRSVDKWLAENNMVERTATPKHIVYDVYHGDLIIALNNRLIPLEQEWFLGVDSHYFNYETEEVLTVPFQFDMPLMSFDEFRFGSTTVKMPRGSGIYTRWKGINDELNELLLSEVPVGFERIRSDALMRVTTKFNNVADYIYFKEAKIARELLNMAV